MQLVEVTFTDQKNTNLHNKRRKCEGKSKNKIWHPTQEQENQQSGTYGGHYGALFAVICNL